MRGRAVQDAARRRHRLDQVRVRRRGAGARPVRPRRPPAARRPAPAASCELPLPAAGEQSDAGQRPRRARRARARRSSSVERSAPAERALRLDRRRRRVRRLRPGPVDDRAVRVGLLDLERVRAGRGRLGEELEQRILTRRRVAAASRSPSGSTALSPEPVCCSCCASRGRARTSRSRTRSAPSARSSSSSGSPSRSEPRGCRAATPSTARPRTDPRVRRRGTDGPRGRPRQRRIRRAPGVAQGRVFMVFSSRSRSTTARHRVPRWTSRSGERPDLIARDAEPGAERPAARRAPHATAAGRAGGGSFSASRRSTCSAQSRSATATAERAAEDRDRVAVDRPDQAVEPVPAEALAPVQVRLEIGEAQSRSPPTGPRREAPDAPAGAVGARSRARDRAPPARAVRARRSRRR